MLVLAPCPVLSCVHGGRERETSCRLTGDWYVGRLLKLHASERHLLVGDGSRLVDGQRRAALAVDRRRLEDRQHATSQTVRCLISTRTSKVVVVK